MISRYRLASKWYFLASHRHCSLTNFQRQNSLPCVSPEAIISWFSVHVAIKSSYRLWRAWILGGSHFEPYRDIEWQTVRQARHIYLPQCREYASVSVGGDAKPCSDTALQSGAPPLQSLQPMESFGPISRLETLIPECQVRECC